LDPEIRISFLIVKFLGISGVMRSNECLSIFLSLLVFLFIQYACYLSVFECTLNIVLIDSLTLEHTYRAGESIDKQSIPTEDNTAGGDDLPRTLPCD